MNFGSKAALVSALLACACGGSSTEGHGAGGAGNSAGTANSGSACPTVTACGGDLVGDWTIKQTCLSVSTRALDAICAGASFTISTLTATGMASFKPDNTLISSAVLSFTENIHFPASCYTKADCTSYAAALAAAPTITNGQCQYDVVTGCSCSANSTQPSMGNGTYQVQGTNVTVLDTASGTKGVNSFCVSGNTLSVYQVDDNGISTTMILTK